MRHTTSGLAFAMVLLALGAVADASATVIPVDQSYFAGDPVVGFDGLPDLTQVQGLRVDGLLFNTGFYLGLDPMWHSGGTAFRVEYNTFLPPPASGTPTSIFGYALSPPSRERDYLRVTLDSETTAFGFNFGVDGRPGQDIRFYDHNQYVGTAMMPPRTSSTFFWTTGSGAFASTVPFDRVEISIGEGYFYFNSFTYKPSPVPEPSAIALVGTGIAGVFGSKQLSRLRRK